MNSSKNLSAYAMAGIRADERPKPKHIKKGETWHLKRLDSLKELVCGYYHISFEDFISHCREMELVLVRKVFAYIAYRYCKISLKKIGNYMNRDHTTIIFYQQSVRDILETEPHRAREIQYLSAKIFA